jgi:hypothetical protein
MAVSTRQRLVISDCGLASFYSYELSGDYLVGRLFGLIPMVRIHLAAIHYLRLASRTELSPLYLLFKWVHFLPHRRAACPLYVLQTRSRHRIFLKLDQGAHFRLKRVMGRHTIQNKRVAA